ncbi:MAG: TonB-dependent receptor [Cyclobacteriaceae bacterium]
MSKYALIGMILQTVLFSMITAREVEGQKSIENVLLTIDVNGSRIEDAFAKIEKASGFTFSYKRNSLGKKKIQNAKVGEASLADILRSIGKETNLKFKRVNETIHVSKSNTSRGYVKEGAVLLEDVNITGKITDENGEGLPGASIVQKGTTNGATTDLQGNYKLVVPEQSILVVSYVGYVTQEIEMVGRSTIDVTMELDAETLSEVVVVGYGTQRKSDLTGSLSSVGSKDFQAQPLTRIDQALQGRAAGVQVTQTSGAPGAGFKIRIRGANSISGNNNPLYVIDGLVVGDINSINVNDIESMEVLKDASATAIYGSRGANGVVLITTKRGKSGAAKIELETFYGVSTVTQRLKVMNAGDFAEGVNHIENQDVYSAAEIADLRAQGTVEDWQDLFFRSAPFSNVQMNVSGGNEKIDYYVSGNYYNADGTIIDQNYKRYSLRSNVNAKLTDKFKVGLNTYFSREENTGVRANLSTGLSWDLTTPAFNDDGDYNFVPLKAGVGNGSPNQLIQPNENVRNNLDHQFIGNTYFNYDILPNLVLNISAGIERLDVNNNSYTSLLVNQTGSATVLNRAVTRLQNTNRLTYTYDKNPDHKVQIDAVHEQQEVTNVRSQAVASGFFSDNTTYKNLALGAIQNTTNASTSESLQSFLGRVNYTLFDRFMFTASVRSDGSSKFREGNRWGVFPSGSFAWRMSDEAFMLNAGVIDNLKLRISHGKIGSQAINALATRSIPIINTNVNYPFTGDTYTVGVAPSNRLANSDLTWETTTQTNFGFDLGLWSSKLTLSFEYYSKNTTDLLLDRSLPTFGGPTLITQNVGEVQNKGFEFSIGTTVLDNDDWDISSNLTISKNSNEVVALIDGVETMELGQDYYGQTFPVKPTRVEVGKPISSFRGYLFEGVYQLGEEAEAAAFNKVPGDGKYKDVNGDGLLTSDDITTVGDGNPAFTWGWNWSARWKAFDLNFLLIGSHGNDIYNFQRMRMMGLGSAQFHAVHADYVNRWTPENPSNTITARRDGTEFLSSQFIEDGSYVTMKTIALGYNFNNVLNNIGLQSLRVYVSAENLFILTGYQGFDPESTSTGGSDVDLGIDFNAYPINKSFSVGMKVTF